MDNLGGSSSEDLHQQKKEHARRRSRRHYDKYGNRIESKDKYKSHAYHDRGHVSRYPQDHHRHKRNAKRITSSRYDENGRLVSRSSRRSLSQRSQS